MEGGGEMRIDLRRGAADPADQRPRRLLRPSQEGPGDGRTAERRKGARAASFDHLVGAGEDRLPRSCGKHLTKELTCGVG